MEQPDQQPISERFNRVLAEYLLRIDRGEQVDRQQFIEDHAEVADQLLGYFRDLDTSSRALDEEGEAESQSKDVTVDLPRQFGSYVLLEKLGAGGMGVVYKAEHRAMERMVAIKTIHPRLLDSAEAVERFHREVKSAARLSHPNIVTAHDAGAVAGIHFLAVDYVAGEDLGSLVRRLGPLPVGRAIDCVMQAAQGLQHAHEANIIHRDVKPGNLLLDSQGVIKVLDMGLARQHSEGDEQPQLTGTYQIMGTVDYMAPEQAKSSRLADARADIYSLGATLWTLLTGCPLYDGETTVDKLVAHRQQPIPSLRQTCPQVSGELDTAFAKMVAKTPEERQQTMAEVIVDLQRCRAAYAPVPSTISNMEEEGLGAGREPLAATAICAEDQGVPPQVPDSTQVIRSAEADTDPQSQQSLAEVAENETDQLHPLSKPWWRRPASWVAVVAVGTLLVVLAGITFFVRTKDGVIRAEIDDPRVEVSIKGTDIVLKQADKEQEVRVSPGHHTLIIQRGDFRFETDEFTLRQNDDVTVRVEFLAGKVEVWQDQKLIGQDTLPEKELVVKDPSDEKGLPSLANAPPLAIAPFDAATAKRHQQAWADYLGMPAEKEIDLGNGVTLTMVLIPPGEFAMGSSEEEQERFLERAKAEGDDWGVHMIPSEGPQHRVRISRPFYLGKFELTQGQWRAVMGNNPSQFKDTPSHPVEQVSWEEIQLFVKKANNSGESRDL